MQTRQQWRKEIREVTKSLDKARKTKEFKNTEEFFSSLKGDDLILLKAKTHPDPKLAEQYDRYIANMKYLIGLEARLDFLSRGRIMKNDTSLVKQDKLLSV